MILLIFLSVFGKATDCEEVCCGTVCQQLCGSESYDFICPEFLSSSPAQNLDCMKQFLLLETEIRTLFYNVKYYGQKEILQQLIEVLKILPVMHADCYLALS